ncbi:MAG: DUF4338 domain-containing protein [Acidiferrobacteraceae bacterium]
MATYCGRQFAESEIEAIRTMIAADPDVSRYRLSTRVCEQLNWRRTDGKLKDMSCRVALLRMQADGLLTLPEPKRAKLPAFILKADIESEVDCPLIVPEVDLSRLTVDLVQAQKRESRLWIAYMRRHHYLGHQPIPGAQLRYFVRHEGEIVALLAFGASAWTIRPRDDYIGWSHEQRQRNLHLVVGNSRFLVLPWIRRQNLASKALAMITRRLAKDWQQRYSYRPVLIETFIEDGRFRGTCYQAANWQCLGKTKGRGKLDRANQRALPVKSIWLYPLATDFRRRLCS